MQDDSVSIRCLPDPFIDDNIDFARRLRQLNVEHQLTVVEQWPHGFLDFGLAAADLGQYNEQIIQMLKKIIQQNTLQKLSDRID